MDIENARRRLNAGPLRVQAHPATHAWLSGDRFGNVTTVGRRKIRVQMDRSGHIRTFRPENLEPVQD
ncbi:hypothetical protein AB0B04_18870 [Streptomyces xinghaiensis]|uniref:Uncharacterized protein n=2 Tax=Streptomyces TaxID=1883 RepID=A0A420UXY8_9ACTN|nr:MULTISPECIES: hypothetical protein [Streptomyces]KNE81385.1 hypothetical protein ADZ36_16525 [Streptomyces fradiae]OFA48276.1 hypothetical protein BEN35_19240 [Streptomyces fradiae]PQM20655.1 hypothetical protein Sfr7A_26075 [Streptomyces xinghaiensis]RKM92595.1 hypothetical protein SFRA_024730 [Streptomyces xinghaiensis]RNC70563.1 hypothetical protein DC095_025720 [Streptomyces xinghaiensis]